LYATLTKGRPHLKKDAHMHHVFRLSRALLPALLIFGCSPFLLKKNITDKPKQPTITLTPPSDNYFSVDQEIEMGKEELAKSLEDKETIFIKNPHIDQYLQKLTANLVRHLPPDAANIPVRVFVIKSINFPPGATSIYGGYIFLQLESVASARSEDELAMRISHEIGHVELRHATLWETQRRFFEEYIHSQNYDNSQIYTYIFNLRIQYEDEADIFAIHLALTNGYDPSDYMLYLVEKYDFPPILAYFNQHRPGGQRKILMEQEVQKIMKGNTIHTTKKSRNTGHTQFETIRNIAINLFKKH